MRKMRKGFTLVELLIVIAILGTLSATMSASITGSTAKAKAAAIAQNVETLKSAASMYYVTNMENSTTLDEATTTTVIEEYVKTWADFNRDGIKYEAAADTVKGRENWAVTVDFTADGEVETIKTELAKIKGYGTYGATGENPTSRVNSGKFTVKLFDGTITAAE